MQIRGSCEKISFLFETLIHKTKESKRHNANFHKVMNVFNNCKCQRSEVKIIQNLIFSNLPN